MTENPAGGSGPQQAGAPGLATNSAGARGPNVTAAPESGLTCFGFKNADPRVYYLDPDNVVNQLAWVDDWFGWENTVLPGTAAAGSHLTCFARENAFPRVYYLGPDNVSTSLN